MIKVSVVTVTYNAMDSIICTLNSILSQTYTNIELIIFDGGSTDGTVEKIERRVQYETNVVFHSCPDDGIYDAMNKAVKRCSGDYIIFMNSGDLFYSSSTVEEAVLSMGKGRFDILVGNTVVDTQSKVKRRGDLSLKSISMPFCHQSIFFSSSCFDGAIYDISYRLSADFHLCLRLISKGAVVIMLEQIISRVSSGGVSDIRRNEVWLEYERAIRELGLLTPVKRVRFLLQLRWESIKSFIKFVLGYASRQRDGGL